MGGGMPTRARGSCRARAALAWGCLIFVGLQLGLPLARECWPGLRDPEYGRRLARLQARLAERRAGQPLVLFVGSSRTSFGIRPTVVSAALAQQLPAADRPVVFNFSFNGAGP